VNKGLEMFQYKPKCPFDQTNELSIKIFATPMNGIATRQIVFADVGKRIEISGSGSHSILEK